ncbi:MAG: pyruvate ferredoxin oxidoreductase, partial [Alphaproteobacteria bacterium]
TEVRYLAHEKQLQALRLIPEIGGVFTDVFGRESGGLIHPYRTEGAETIAVAMGSVNGTIKEVVDAMREDGAAVGSISICSFRPFPLDELEAALAGAKHVVVIEKSLAPGGGRPITMASLREVLEAAAKGRLPDVQFLDLDHGAVEREILRARGIRRSGPTAENILKSLGTVAVAGDD